MIRVSQLWDYIETLDFCEDIEGNRPPDYYNEEDDDKVKANDKDNNNNNDDNDDKGISSLGLDRDLGFLQDIKNIEGNQPPNDDNEVELFDPLVFLGGSGSRNHRKLPPQFFLVTPLH